MNNQSIQSFLNQLIPLGAIAATVQHLLIYFMAIGALMVLAGTAMATSKGVTTQAFARAGILIACIAATPWFMNLLEELAGGLVQGIASVDPQLNWLIVNNPGNNAVVMDYTKPFAVIGQYVAGTFTQTQGIDIMHLDKAWQYGARIILIAIAGTTAAATVFLMELLLLIQKAIMIASGPLFAMFVGGLALPSAHGAAVHFFKQVIGVTCWPVGWAICHIATIAVLNKLQPPNWSAGLAELTLPLIVLGVTCAYMVFVTIAAPALIVALAINGNNFAHHLISGAVNAAGQHTEHVVRSTAAVGGAIAGSVAGPVGASTGAALGGAAGGILATPSSAISSAVTGAQPSARSSGMADMAIRNIRAKA